MSCWRIKPLENTIALGGVATGSIKAQEHATDTITEMMIAEMPKLSATPANKGTSSAAVAVFEVNSVKKTTKQAMIKNKNKGDVAAKSSSDMLLCQK